MSIVPIIKSTIAISAGGATAYGAQSVGVPEGEDIIVGFIVFLALMTFFSPSFFATTDTIPTREDFFEEE